MTKPKQKINKRETIQSGQTLIETLVGAFVLVMGVSAAVGLAVYVFGASSNISKQIIGMGLARQGLETMKNMRDTNWLKATLTANCYNFETGRADAYCYQDWIGLKSGAGQWGINGLGGSFYDRGYNMNPGNTPQSRALTVPDVDPANKTWAWNLNSPTTNRFGLDFNSLDVTDAAFAGFYVPSGAVAGQSGFYSQVILTEDTSMPPYDNASVNSTLGPLLKIQSRVWWNDKGCASSTTYGGASPSCRIELVGYLTNWKDYQ